MSPRWKTCSKPIILEEDFPDAIKVKLVCDNLNTHTIGAFYETFDRRLARSLVERLEFCHTPKHGSWLNIAENELSVLTRQCVHGCRFGTIEELREEVMAWASQCNNNKRRPMTIQHQKRAEQNCIHYIPKLNIDKALAISR